MTESADVSLLLSTYKRQPPQRAALTRRLYRPFGADSALLRSRSRVTSEYAPGSRLAPLAGASCLVVRRPAGDRRHRVGVRGPTGWLSHDRPARRAVG
jgi:hypothetical protein